MCLYDLEKAFDSVEFFFLLQRLFNVGVNSKTWRILQDWYTDYQSSVRLGQYVSSSFSLGRRVRQVSILFPALFLLVMDTLLRQLQSISSGASVKKFMRPAFCMQTTIARYPLLQLHSKHRSLPSKKFTKDNFLK